ncbi:MAG: DUF1080 domain-containing protein [Planctomycetales bacterium]
MIACRRFAIVIAVLVAAAPQRASAQQEGVYTDPEDAGREYALQGEYAGEIGGKKYGAQVIALGDGKYDIVVYEGGLPGDGWTRKDPKRRGTGVTREGTGTLRYATLSGDGWQAIVGAKEVMLTGKLAGRLERVDRKSPTLGAKPPAGAVILFDGKSAEQFKNGKMTDDGLLMADCETNRKFGDHALHVEFRTPFVPKARGQGRGNSGVYVQNRYEVQVLDSFGLEGKNNECGGIYGGTEPIVNMCYPPLTWQTYDIDFTAARYDQAGNKIRNARMTVQHNGVVIHDDAELPKHTPGKNAEGPGPDGMYLQGHGNPVVYRNIWVVEKK